MPCAEITTIVPLDESHFIRLHRALDIVAREKRYLAFLQAPPRDEARNYYRHLLATDQGHFVVVQSSDVVGWCDVVQTHGEARAHLGQLGMGLVPQARRQGLGTRLLNATLAKARSKGLTRIELHVRTDNTPAKTLCARFGFQVEGLQRHNLRVDGQYHDAYAMALTF